MSIQLLIIPLTLLLNRVLEGLCGVERLEQALRSVAKKMQAPGRKFGVYQQCAGAGGCRGGHQSRRKDRADWHEAHQAPHVLHQRSWHQAAVQVSKLRFSLSIADCHHRSARRFQQLEPRRAQRLAPPGAVP